MKQIFLTAFFTLYVLFMPFVYVNCSVADEPYAVTEETESEDETLARCEGQEFVTAECVDILQAESERVTSEEAQVSEAESELSDFESCKTVAKVSTDSSSTEDSTESTETESVDCATVIATIVSAYQVCDELREADKYSDCSSVEDSVNAALSDCDDGDSTVTSDFCSTLTA